MDTFGQRLRTARKQKRLTQRQLAELLSCKHNSISNWENDQNRPTLEVVKKISTVLEVDLNWLLGDAPATPGEDPLDQVLIAALDGQKEFSSQELEEIREFAKYVISKRGKRS